MDHRSSECTHEKIVKMIPASQVLGVGGGGRKRTEVLSGMIVWNVLVLVLLVLAVCVQGRGGAVPSVMSSHMALRRSPQSENVKEGVGIPERAQSAENPTLSPPSSRGNDSGKQQDSKTASKSTEEADKNGEEEATQGGKERGGDTQATPENKGGNMNSTTEEHGGNGSLPSHLPGMSTEAVLRAFYVFVGIGAIILIYIVIKLARLRKRRAPGKYRVLSHTDDQEMFPLAAGEGEDEEIFNAAHHQPRK